MVTFIGLDTVDPQSCSSWQKVEMRPLALGKKKPGSADLAVSGGAGTLSGWAPARMSSAAAAGP